MASKLQGGNGADGASTQAPVFRVHIQTGTGPARCVGETVCKYTDTKKPESISSYSPPASKYIERSFDNARAVKLL